MFAFIDMKGLNMLRDDCFLERRKSCRVYAPQSKQFIFYSKEYSFIISSNWVLKYSLFLLRWKNVSNNFSFKSSIFYGRPSILFQTYP